MTILDLAKLCNVNTIFYVRDSLREIDVEIGTAAMVVALGTGESGQIAHVDARDNALYIQTD
jgi:hypothetical protein